MRRRAKKMKRVILFIRTAETIKRNILFVNTFSGGTLNAVKNVTTNAADWEERKWCKWNEREAFKNADMS